MVILWTPICGSSSRDEPDGLFEQLSEFSTVKGLYPQILDSYPQDTPCGLPQDDVLGQYPMEDIHKSMEITRWIRFDSDPPDSRISIGIYRLISLRSSHSFEHLLD